MAEDYLLTDLELHVGDFCVVETGGSTSVGQVKRPRRPLPEFKKDRLYRRVLRAATAEEAEEWRQRRKREVRGVETSQRLARSRGLQIKIVDVAIEAVGIPATFDLCTRIVRAGGTVANIGVHGAPTTLHLEDLWIKNITITTGLVSGNTIPTLLKLARGGRIEAEKLGTHHFALGDIEEAYDVFGAAGEHDALKVVIQA